MIKVEVFIPHVPKTPPTIVTISMTLEEASHLKRILNSAQLNENKIERDGKGAHTLSDATRDFKNTLWNELADRNIMMAVSATGVRE